MAQPPALRPPLTSFLLGTLWSRVSDQRAYARRVGALVSLATNATTIADGGVPFIVRQLTAPHLPVPSPNQRATVNPFLPYDPDLFVADLSPTHLCLLNKFNVVDAHLLIVTRHFEAQTSWLTLADFDAMWCCLHEFDGLAFYNSGPTAGASQPHKHLQCIPFQGAAEVAVAPISALLPTAIFVDGVGTIPQLPYAHALVHCLPTLLDLAPNEAAQWSLHQYQRLCAQLAVQPDRYNLLATRGWLMLVPRRQERSHGISVNALGFAGSLLVREQTALDYVRQVGPLAILQQVAQSPNHCNYQATPP